MTRQERRDMAKKDETFRAYGAIEGHVIMVLTPREAQALEGISGYNNAEFLKVFKEKFGSHYMRGREDALVSLLEKAHAEIPPIMDRINHANAVQAGFMIAVRPEELQRLREASAELFKLQGDTTS
jgi:hypothetical protein